MSVRKFTYCLLCALCGLTPARMQAQRKVILDIQRTIELATDSSLTAQKSASQYAQTNWDYQAFLAGRKPQIIFESKPLNLERYFVESYNYENNLDFYRQRRLFYTSGQVEVSQAVEKLGGTIYGGTGLTYLKAFGNENYQGYSAVPIKIGYKQNLFGFNSLKWERKLETVKMDAAQKMYAYHRELAGGEAVKKFFDLVVAQSQYQVAEDNLAATDTLYTTGQRKFKIASISQPELYILDIDRMNAQTSVVNYSIELDRAKRELAVFLKMDPDTDIELVMPSTMLSILINEEEAVQYAQDNNPKYLQNQVSIVKAEMAVAQAEQMRKFTANLDMYAGFNQIGVRLKDAYSNPLFQDYVALSLSIPIKDWGRSKYKVASAKEALAQAQLSYEQDAESLSLEVRSKVRRFNEQQALVQNALMARDLADRAYNGTFKLFMNGAASVNDITLARNRRENANLNYINALKNYWISYFDVRSITLYDFATGTVITHE